MTASRREDLDELLADAVLFGAEGEVLAVARREAETLGLDFEAERSQWERVAGTAAAAVAVRYREEVPPALMRRLQADALALFAQRGALRWEDVVRRQAPPGPPPPVGRSLWLTYVAAAAALLLAFAVFFGPEAGRPRDPASARAALLESGAVDVQREWKPTDNPVAQNLQGDVVWSTRRQEGYLRLRGLEPNDPAVRQYQLWIVDARRGMPPVDGGVFDMPAGAEEAVIPIRAKLPVATAELFVITVEPPGGVVVSAPEKYAAIAGG